MQPQRLGKVLVAVGDLIARSSLAAHRAYMRVLFLCHIHYRPGVYVSQVSLTTVRRLCARAPPVVVGLFHSEFCPFLVLDLAEGTASVFAAIRAYVHCEESSSSHASRARKQFYIGGGRQDIILVSCSLVRCRESVPTSDESGKQGPGSYCNTYC
jgi:hypothetical protein